MNATTLVDPTRLHRPTTGRPGSHRREAGARPAATTPSRATTRAERGGSSASSADRAHAGTVYRTAYLPPALMGVLVGLFVLTLGAGVSLGIGLMVMWG